MKNSQKNKSNKANEGGSEHSPESFLPSKTERKYPFSRLVHFQLKLAVDAFRDVLLSPASIICSLIDIIEKKPKEDSYFEKLMVFGRNTEKRINLFEQHKDKNSTIDSILGQVEELLLEEYESRAMSKRTLSAIEKILKKEVKK